MKKSYLIISFFLFSFLLNAQEIKVTESKENIGGAKNPVLTVIIYDADESTIEKAWKSLMKGYDAKVSTKDGVYANNANISDISAKTIDVYAMTEKQNDGIKLTVAIDLGGAFLSSSAHPDQYKAAEKIVRNFAIDICKKAVQEKLDEAMKQQKGLESNLKDLVKKNDKLHKEIEDYKDRISDDEKDIETNQKDQGTTNNAIDSQKKVVEEIQKKLDKIR